MDPSASLLNGETDSGIQIVPHPETDQEKQKWLAARRTGIGASDISTVLGVNEYQTPLQLWLEKTGQIPGPDETIPMWLGKKFEPIVAEWFERETGYQLTKTGLWRSKERPWQLATPDRIVRGENALVEIKLHGFSQAPQWADGQTSDHAELQSTQQIDVLGVSKVYVVALIAGYGWSFEVREITRNNNIVKHIRTAGEQMWNNVLNGTPPASIDREALHTIKRAYPAIDGEEKELDQAGQLCLEQYREYRSQESEASATARAAKKRKEGALVKYLEYLAGAQVATVAGTPVAVTHEIPRAGYNVPASSWTKIELINNH